MLGLSRTHLLFCFSVASIATASFVAACTAETTDTPDADDGGPGPRKRDGAKPGEEEEEDGSVDPGNDAGEDAKPEKDANGPGEAGAECAFNRDCQAALRCECDESTGCACQPGARGTGKNGIDACDSGNQCASSLCVEGPDPGESICSDECKTEDDCTGKLPRCIPVFGIPENICAREPPQ